MTVSFESLTLVLPPFTIKKVEEGSSAARYRLGERLAAGGMAEVFRAVALGAQGFERPVVLKRILPEFARDPKYREMFIGEARVMASLSHRNIVHVYDFGLLDDSFYIAFELVDGCTLRDALDAVERRGLVVRPALAAYIAAEFLRGLDYAHRKTDATGHPIGIVHRDVSPDNVLISFEGEVKVTDFGIARTRDAVRRTQPGLVKGKILYLSPEVLQGLDADPRADIFAAGMVLCEAVAGRHPLDGEPEARVLQRVAVGDYKNLSALFPEAPADLRAIADRAVAFDPKVRYAAAGEMVRDLDAFVTQTGEPMGPSATAAWLCSLEIAPQPALGGKRASTTTGGLFTGELVRALVEDGGVTRISTKLTTPVIPVRIRATPFVFALGVRASDRSWRRVG